jgi:hypothetical protein
VPRRCSYREGGGLRLNPLTGEIFVLLMRHELLGKKITVVPVQSDVSSIRFAIVASGVT